MISSTAQWDDKKIIRQLIDTGADCIDLPTPGSRHGISVSYIQELVQFIHIYKPGTLAMTVLNSSVEGADPNTVRLIALKMKETGADMLSVMVALAAATRQRTSTSSVFPSKEDLTPTLEWPVLINKQRGDISSLFQNLLLPVCLRLSYFLSFKLIKKWSNGPFFNTFRY